MQNGRPLVFIRMDLLRQAKQVTASMVSEEVRDHQEAHNTTSKSFRSVDRNIRKTQLHQQIHIHNSERYVESNYHNNNFIDYTRLREIISMSQVLELIAWCPTARTDDQLRGACPVHW